VPDGFRFAVKLRRSMTHERRLADCESLLAAFLEEIAPLGDRLGPLLIQLPPSLAFDPSVAGAFFADLRRRHPGAAACEPRHASWFGPEAERLLIDHRIARVAADPARVPRAARPGGWPQLLYVRLHGAPRIYFSPYSAEELDRWAALIDASPAAERWCVLDNTGAGAAAGDALDLMARLA
jgi:uncharacterized protein YecE (DUF72 family)